MPQEHVLVSVLEAAAEAHAQSEEADRRVANALSSSSLERHESQGLAL